MPKLNDLRSPSGSTSRSKRLGRGPGSGTGKTSGRGHKGHKARTGTPHRPWFEGGQMPIQRRVPKRGFTNLFRTEYEIVNVRDLARVEEDVITPDVLAAYRLVDLGSGRGVKILGDGDLERKLVVHAHAFTRSARAKIEAAGGSVETIGGPTGRPARLSRVAARDAAAAQAQSDSSAAAQAESDSSEEEASSDASEK